MAVKLGALCLLFLFIGQASGHFFPFFHFDAPTTDHEKSSITTSTSDGTTTSTSDGTSDGTTTSTSDNTSDGTTTSDGPSDGTTTSTSDGTTISTSDGYNDIVITGEGGLSPPTSTSDGYTDFTTIDDGSGGFTSSTPLGDYTTPEITDPVTVPPSKQPNNYETNYKGDWEIFVEKAGVAAMHLQVFPNNKAVMFDTTILGDSLLPLPKGEPCVARDPEKPHILDCTAHSAEIDLATGAIRPLVVHTDTWCSSAGLNKDGVLVQAGGFINGGRVVRYLDQCETCDWKEYPDALSIVRWYATQQILPDGSFVVVGGRDGFSYEYVPAPGKKNAKAFQLPFLTETRDNITTGKDLKGREIQDSENNLYPHVHLSTDGNLFIFANYRSILLDPKNNKIIRRFPDLPGGSRNYPGSSPSVVLPIKMPSKKKQTKNIPVEVAICGGAKKDAYLIAKVKKQFVPTLQTCGRIKITDANAKWKIELMPTPRVMGDMLILPTGDMLILNGAKSGSAGWEYAEDPNLSPVLYSPSKPKDKRFQELAPSNIPRMYHSSAAVLTDGKILVAGSSTHQGYKFHDVKYPTELRIEKFSPHYLDPTLASDRPEIYTNFDGKKFAYNQEFLVDFNLNGGSSVKNKDIKVTIYSPPFTTHSYSMNQRMIVLAKGKLTQEKSSTHRIQVTAPPSGAVAPPGYYMLFVVYRGLPSQASWIKIY